MLQANELRIGNWVDMDGKFITVNSGYEIDEYESSYSPIALTPEILEKCGFRFSKKGNLGLEFPVRMSFVFHQGNVGDLDLVQDNTRISFRFGYMKYLHQLQNLYFALTGQELEVKMRASQL